MASNQSSSLSFLTKRKKVDRSENQSEENKDLEKDETNKDLEKDETKTVVESLINERRYFSVGRLRQTP